MKQNISKNKRLEFLVPFESLQDFEKYYVDILYVDFPCHSQYGLIFLLATEMFDDFEYFWFLVNKENLKITRLKQKNQFDCFLLSSVYKDVLISCRVLNDFYNLEVFRIEKDLSLGKVESLDSYEMGLNTYNDLRVHSLSKGFVILNPDSDFFFDFSISPAFLVILLMEHPTDPKLLKQKTFLFCNDQNINTHQIRIKDNELIVPRSSQNNFRLDVISDVWGKQKVKPVLVRSMDGSGIILGDSFILCTSGLSSVSVVNRNSNKKSFTQEFKDILKFDVDLIQYKSRKKEVFVLKHGTLYHLRIEKVKIELLFKFKSQDFGIFNTSFRVKASLVEDVNLSVVFHESIEAFKQKVTKIESTENLIFLTKKLNLVTAQTSKGHLSLFRSVFFEKNKFYWLFKVYARTSNKTYNNNQIKLLFTNKKTYQFILNVYSEEVKSLQTSILFNPKERIQILFKYLLFEVDKESESVQYQSIGSFFDLSLKEVSGDRISFSFGMNQRLFMQNFNLFEVKNTDIFDFEKRKSDLRTKGHLEIQKKFKTLSSTTSMNSPLPIYLDGKRYFWLIQ